MFQTEVFVISLVAKIFYRGTRNAVFLTEIFAISLVAKMLCIVEIQDQNIVVLVNCQAATMAISNSTIKLGTVLQLHQKPNWIR